jgi:alpha,alpha-trehalose phosphorylase
MVDRDDDFDRDYALPILVETARLWMSLGYFGRDAKFHIDGVTGPDEYTAIVADNTYTNLMAARNLSIASETAARWKRRARQLDVTAKEMRLWSQAAEAIAMPFDEELASTNNSAAPRVGRSGTSRGPQLRQVPLPLNFLTSTSTGSR